MMLLGYYRALLHVVFDKPMHACVHGLGRNVDKAHHFSPRVASRRMRSKAQAQKKKTLRASLSLFPTGSVPPMVVADGPGEYRANRGA